MASVNVYSSIIFILLHKASTKRQITYIIPYNSWLCIVHDMDLL